jgi:hypothetical protein
MFKNIISGLLKILEICAQDFIKRSLVDMKRAVASWLDEPSTYSATILNSFHFLIDGKAKKDIETFIKKKPKERTATILQQDCVNYLYHRVYRVATAALWRTFHHEGKISPGWCVWGGCRPTPFHYIYHHQ